MGFENMTTGEARLAVLAAGAVLIALVYLWGIRARLRASFEERARRRAQRSAHEKAALDSLRTGEPIAEKPIGEVSAKVAPHDPFAHQRLVDVEIIPVVRDKSGTPVAAAEAAAEPEPAGSEPVRGESLGSQPVGSEPAAPESRAEPAATVAVPATEPAPGEPRREPGEAKAESRQEPKIEIPRMDLRPAANAKQPAAMPQTPPRATPPAAPTEFVILTITAEAGGRFTGTEILMAAHELGLKFSTGGLFDGYPGEVQGKPVFSIANLVEPGNFPPSGVQRLSTPGLLLFMRLPGAMEPLPALEFMLGQARRLAARLGGTLCDEKRLRLGPDGISTLRLRIGEYQRRLPSTTTA